MLASLFACQFLRPSSDYLDPDMFPTLNISFSKDDPYDRHTPDVKIPYFTLIEFISYVGWIKVAETLLNPFGEDDEDFQINYLIDRNVQVSYMIVDDADMEMELATDPFLGKLFFQSMVLLLIFKVNPIPDAGIEIPAELPYKDGNLRDASGRDVVGVPEDDQGLINRIRKISTSAWQNRRPSTTSSANMKRLESVMEERQDPGTETNSTLSLQEVVNLENEIAKL